MQRVDRLSSAASPSLRGGAEREALLGAGAGRARAACMFFHIPIERELLLHPRLLGPHVTEHLKEKLLATVEGSCSGRHGYIISVTEIVSQTKGQIREGTGITSFTMKFNAIVFRPFKGEVLDATVTKVNKMGFFAEVGPLPVFVSKHAIPADMTFDQNSNPASYVSQVTDEQPVRIKPESEVRLRIVGTHFDANEIRAIGTIRDDYLGVVQ